MASLKETVGEQNAIEPKTAVSAFKSNREKNKMNDTKSLQRSIRNAE